jgi:hypothetical protein
MICSASFFEPPQRGRQAFHDTPPEDRAAHQAAHEPLISRILVVEVPFTGLSLIDGLNVIEQVTT